MALHKEETNLINHLQISALVVRVKIMMII